LTMNDANDVSKQNLYASHTENRQVLTMNDANDVSKQNLYASHTENRQVLTMNDANDVITKPVCFTYRKQAGAYNE
ncbi:hypothetical protein DRN76_05570, partial [Methanosarcinales archaeon]